MASPTTPQKMLKFEALKDELYSILDNVLEQAEILQTAADNPVVIDREWIIEKLRDQVSAENYVLEPGAVTRIRGLGNLLKLPQELRDMVYGHAITSGTTGIMRASKQTHKEASKLLFPKGIYRLTVRFYQSTPSPRLSPNLAKNIQNLRIRANGRDMFMIGLKKPLGILRLFEGSRVKRKDCILTIEGDPCVDDLEAFQVVRALDKFTGFERVILELDLQWGGEPWPDTMHEFHHAQAWGRICRPLSYQKETLEPTLGKGNRHNDEGAWYRLVFHPRK